MIPIERFQSPAPGSREYNAVAKAVKAKLPVEWLADGDMRRFYKVKDYTVEVYTDPDGQAFGGCECLAAKPPTVEATGLPSREEQPCYHLASVLLHVAETET